MLAEFAGTAFLVMAVVGSGIAAVRLSPGQPGLQLLENSLVTAGALVALILALQPVSAAFNPVVTVVERVLGGISTRDAAALILAQFAGGFRGAVLANLMFDLARGHAVRSAPFGQRPVARRGQSPPSGCCWWCSEPCGPGRTDRVAFAVGGYLLAAYWFTSSTSFANPAVTVSRMFSDTFAGIAPSSVPGFVLAQLAGGVLGYGLIRGLYPGLSGSRPYRLGHPGPSTSASTDPGVAGMTPARPTVLFVCVHNAGRSQMAAGWLSQHRR